LSIDNELAVMEKYNISPNELFLLKTILLALEEGEKKYLGEFLKITKNLKESFRNILVSLQEKGIILKSYKIPKEGEQLKIEDIELNKNVVKTMFKASFDMGKELFDSYPTTTVVNGCVYKLRRVSKKYDSLEDAFKAYGKYIRWNQETHKQVIELIKWGIENGYSFTTLDSFIVDMDWLNIAAIKNGELSNVNVETTRMI